MPRYTAQVWVPGDYPYDAEINAVNSIQARKTIARREGVDENYVNRVFEVNTTTQQHSSSSSLNIGGAGSAISLILLLWIFIEFTPWILMIILGGLGLWLGEKITGLSVSDYTDHHDNQNHKHAAIILALTLIAGGFGFIQGNQIQHYLNTDTQKEQQS